MSPPVRPSIPNHLRLSLACDLAAVRPLADAVLTFLSTQGCRDSERHDCELALVEACNNAIAYARKEQYQDVAVEVVCGLEYIELRVTDHTTGFELPPRVPPPDPESLSGRGLFLIQAVMDTTRYDRGPSGNTLVLRKIRGPGC